LTGFTYSFPQSPKGRFRHIYLPEAQLVALLVIITKLFYPFDDVKRYPLSWEDPTALVINWETWATAQRRFDDRDKECGRLGKGNELKVKEADAFNMTPQQLDDYMDWYEKMWTGTKGSVPVAKTLTKAPGLTDAQSRIHSRICFQRLALIVTECVPQR
jgi:RNA polymerase I-specific transcription initiation factor RRN7